MGILQKRISPLTPDLHRPLAAGRRLGDGWTLLVFWLLAVAAVAACTWNYHAVTRFGMEKERLTRLALPADSPGHGLLAPLAARQPPALLDPDSYAWVSIVQRQLREGDLRNRWFPYDNASDHAPAGRPLHWSASFAWWMILCAAPVHWLGGHPWPEAVAEAAPWANPVLFALALAVLGLAARRRVGVWGAGMLMVTLASLWGVEWDFCYGRPDHHGLHIIASVGMLLCVLGAGLGWVRTDGAEGTAAGEDTAARAGFLPLVRPASWKSARRGFLWSAIFGAAGLWIGATQQMFFVGSVGAAAAVGALLFVRGEGAADEAGAAVRFVPGLWRDWARTGALASVCFYLLEYFPFHLGMRLEVNGPLHALAWWGGGELIYATGEWARHRPRRRWPDRAGWTRAAVGGLCLGALPAAVLCGPHAWFVARDPVLGRIMATVSEGLPMVGNWTWRSVVSAAWQVGPVVFALPVAAGLLLVPRWRRTLTPWRAMGLWVALVPAAVCLAWLFVQRRWLGLEGAGLAVLALAAAPAAAGGGRVRLPWLLLVLTVPAWLHFAAMRALLDPEQKSDETLDPLLATAEVAWNLRLDPRTTDPAARPLRVVAPMGMSTAMHAYGGVDTVGSLYWENLAASLEQERFLGDDAPGEPDARRIARERGLDYVVVRSDPESVVQVQWIDRGKVDPATVPRLLVFRLANPMHPTPPDWLEAVPLRDAPAAEAYGLRLYRVRPERL